MLNPFQLIFAKLNNNGGNIWTTLFSGNWWPRTTAPSVNLLQRLMAFVHTPKASLTAAATTTRFGSGWHAGCYRIIEGKLEVTSPAKPRYTNLWANSILVWMFGNMPRYVKYQTYASWLHQSFLQWLTGIKWMNCLQQHGSKESIRASIALIDFLFASEKLSILCVWSEKWIHWGRVCLTCSAWFEGPRQGKINLYNENRKHSVGEMKCTSIHYQRSRWESIYFQVDVESSWLDCRCNRNKRLLQGPNRN